MNWKEDTIKCNDVVVKTAEGNCSSYNIIYLVSCSLCNECYVGRSTRPLKCRISEHRQHFYKIIKGENFDPNSDEFALGNHLFSHGYHDRSDFNKFYNVCLLAVCSPKVLDVKEHLFIHKLKTLIPRGINLSNPFVIPLLHNTPSPYRF